MDKIILTQSQLTYLAAFIKSRGFHDPGVIVEILDHFACKVEEKMSENPNLRFEDAVVNAHLDFGTLGFYPLLASYEVNTKKKYKKIYRAERKKILTNPTYIIPSILISLFFFKFYGWSELTVQFININLFNLLLYIASIGLSVSLVMKFKTAGNRNIIYGTIMSGDYFSTIILVSVIQVHDKPYSPTGLTISAVICALLCFYLIIWSFAVYATLKIGKQEVDMVNSYLKNEHT